MMRLIPLCFCLLLTTLVSSQNLAAYSPAKLEQANTAAKVSFMDENEKQALMLINLARMDGKAFIKNVLDPYVRAGGVQNNNYLKTLYTDLQASPALQPLAPEPDLVRCARSHAQDMGSKGRTGHTGSNGVSFGDRVRACYEGSSMAENISYGEETALGIVMQLLIDNGVPSLGHRKNILGADYVRIGIAIAPHTVYDVHCVMDFSD